MQADEHPAVASLPGGKEGRRPVRWLRRKLLSASQAVRAAIRPQVRACGGIGKATIAERRVDKRTPAGVRACIGWG